MSDIKHVKKDNIQVLFDCHISVDLQTNQDLLEGGLIVLTPLSVPGFHLFHNPSVSSIKVVSYRSGEEVGEPRQRNIQQ